MVFRVTETSCDIIHAQKKLKERFLIEKKSQRSCWVEKGKTETWWENFSNCKVPEFD